VSLPSPPGPVSGALSEANEGGERGRMLRPSTAGVIKQALNHYLQREPEFVCEYFPLVRDRGFASYDDIFRINARQVDALRPLLAESVLCFHKQDGRERNRNVGLLDRRPVDPGFESWAAKKARLWTEASRDLCRVFGLESPL
jgi:hypothetical protein